MNLTDYWRIVLSGWRLILATTILGAAAAAGISLPAAPVYQATTSIFFSLPTGDTGSDLSQGSTFTQAQMLSLAELATQPRVLQDVIDQLDLDTTTRRLARTIDAQATSETVILSITARADSADGAVRVADATADALIEVSRDLSPRNAQGNPSLNASVVGAAERPTFPVSPNTRRNVAIGVLAGLLLGVAVAIGRVLLDTRVRNDDEATHLTSAPVLAQVGRVRGFKRVLLLDKDPHSTTSEAFRRLRVNLRYLRTAHEVSVVTITSSVSSEGKSTTALNFAYACAEAGDRVLLMDGDLRRPTIASHTGLEGAVGVTTVLTGQAALEDVLQRWSGPISFDVLASGEVPPNPTELVESEAMSKLLEQVRARYDLVVIDAPPLLPVSDGAIFAAKTSGAIVVANVRKVRRNELADAVGTLHQLGATALGLVLNATPRQAQNSYYGAQRSWWSRTRLRRRQRVASRRALRRRA